jgi:hypothetical protein
MYMAFIWHSDGIYMTQLTLLPRFQFSLAPTLPVQDDVPGLRVYDNESEMWVRVHLAEDEVILLPFAGL